MVAVVVLVMAMRQLPALPAAMLLVGFKHGSDGGRKAGAALRLAGLHRIHQPIW